LNLPNYLTLLRIALVPVFFTLLISYQTGSEFCRIGALAIFAAAAASDALDGLLARLTRQQTALGTFLDPLADKLLLLSGYVGILWVTRLPYRPPLWITVTIVFRDVVILTGMLTVFAVTRDFTVRPSLAGKVTTFFQMIGLIAILLEHPAAVWLWDATAVLTIFSGVSYVRRGIQEMTEK